MLFTASLAMFTGFLAFLGHIGFQAYGSLKAYPVVPPEFNETCVSLFPNHKNPEADSRKWISKGIEQGYTKMKPYHEGEILMCKLTENDRDDRNRHPMKTAPTAPKPRSNTTQMGPSP